MNNEHLLGAKQCPRGWLRHSPAEGAFSTALSVRKGKRQALKGLPETHSGGEAEPGFESGSF